MHYPDHGPRGESATFRHTKAAGHKARLRCLVTGQPGPEYHHLRIEWTRADAVNWTMAKTIALGEITEVPVFDPISADWRNLPGRVFGYLDDLSGHGAPWFRLAGVRPGEARDLHRELAKHAAACGGEVHRSPGTAFTTARAQPSRCTRKGC